MKYLGIDFGDRKTGLAIGDSASRIASPLEVIKGGSESVEAIKKIISAESIDELVVGVPMATGQHHSSEQLDKVKKFIQALQDQIALPVHQIDERYTTAESQRIKQESGSEAPEDALAAMLILQAFLDSEKLLSA